MRTHEKRPSEALRLLPIGLALLAIPLAACGPISFADDSALVVLGDRPAPSPEPEPEPPKRVEVTADAIVIHEKIQFDYNKASIKQVSHSLLNEIVTTIEGHPQIKKISVEGHTDADGSDSYNEKLSDRRADAVRMYLTEHGVADTRVTSKGWGESRPIADNESDTGKAQNRRVEFIIVEQERSKTWVQVDPATGKQQEITGPAAGGPR
ncbi:MAG: OmpA family protein [Nannocystaceae bacterium]